MKANFKFKISAFVALSLAILVVPALAQGKGDRGEQFKQHRIQMIKQLNLAPDKEKALLALEDKYESQRRQTGADLKKFREELNSALAVPNPDEAKVKTLVSSLTGAMDALFNSFKSQRDEELALMTPVEQGKYLMAMMKWRDEMMGKGGKPETKKKK